MRILNPYMRSIYNKTDLGHLRRIRQQTLAAAYLGGVHRFELKRGVTMTGEMSVMTGQEAKNANLIMVQDFAEAVSLGKPNGERLEQWICREQFIENGDQ